MILKLKNKTTQVYRIACLIASIFMLSTPIKAQIGYQVSLLNKATGEPRANATVNANVTITDSSDGVIYKSTQRATSNDFGILSLTVGDANTFKDFDTGKMPLYISVSLDGTLIGKSQILSVPVAEVANRLKSLFTKEDLVGTWYNNNGYNPKITFTKENTFHLVLDYGSDGIRSISGTFEIESNNIYYYSNEGQGHIRFYDNKLRVIKSIDEEIGILTRK